MAPRSPRKHTQSASDAFLEFTSSVHFDRMLYKYDIAGSIAHAHTLERAGVISRTDLEEIVSSLKEIARAIGSGRAPLDPAFEDIHMNVEKLLTEDLGSGIGGKLHTARSRNDQVALDMRLMVREALASTTSDIIGLEKVILGRAIDAKGVILPGYTHMQRAQPVLLSHHLMAHFWRLQRDLERLGDCFNRTNISPLGSGALAGTSFVLDRKIAAKMLRMDGVTDNSLDAVSDRDFVAESAFALSLLMIHMSSMCEELILWSSREFGFVLLPETLSSGSSMMPQKRNPDIPELIRGKSGRAVGSLIAILTMLKSLPLAYNRDLQEDKENLFDVFDTVGSSLRALTLFLDKIDFDRVRMRESAEVGLLTATDLADFLATKGMSFRTAHGVVKDLATKSNGNDLRFRELAEAALRSHLKEYRVADMSFLSVQKAVDRRMIQGGTGRSAVAVQLDKAEKTVAQNSKSLGKMIEKVEAVDKLLL